tara:strand:+ start:51 stop:356 length:306 start_codon:yes stop_codon:yes gene_type:complete
MQGAPVYTFVILFKCKADEYSNNITNICEIVCETIYETLYHLLIVFIPLFIIVLCVLGGGEGGDINCNMNGVSNIDDKRPYNGIVYSGNGTVSHASGMEMV